MESSNIIVTILSSSILTTIFTSVVNWKLHNSSYRKEYYKKILEKRLEAFESVQSVVSKMSFQVLVGEYSISSICIDNEYYNNFMLKLAIAIDQSFWLDSSTSNKLTEINV